MELSKKTKIVFQYIDDLLAVNPRDQHRTEQILHLVKTAISNQTYMNSSFIELDTNMNIEKIDILTLGYIIKLLFSQNTHLANAGMTIHVHDFKYIFTAVIILYFLGRIETVDNDFSTVVGCIDVSFDWIEMNSEQYSITQKIKSGCSC